MQRLLRKIKGYAILALLLCAIRGWTQEPFTREISLNEQGEPVHVYDLLQDKTGYIWLATERGLSRFDGRRVVPIPDEQPRRATAISLYQESVLVGFHDGTLAILQHGRLVPFRLHGYRITSAITSIVCRHPGILWLTTEEDGLFVVIHGVTIQFTTEEGLTDNFLYEAVVNDNHVLVSSDRGINHLQWHGGKSEIDSVASTDGLTDNITRVLRETPLPGQLLVGTQEEGIFRYDDQRKKVQALTAGKSWSWGQINDILVVDTTTIWICTEEGYLIECTGWTGVNPDFHPYHYKDEKFQRLLLDRSGNLWAATHDGLLMVTALFARTIQMPRSAYAISELSAMAATPDDKLWYATGKQLWQVSVHQSHEPILSYTFPATVTCMHTEPDGRIWVGTLGAGLYVKETGAGWTTVRNKQPLTDNHILSITSAGKELWISSLNGVTACTYVPGADSLKLIKHHGKASGLGSDYVYQLFSSSDKRMWMATDGGGVAMYDGIEYHHWTVKDGLPVNVVYAISGDDSGHIWAGVLQHGLLRFNGHHWQPLYPFSTSDNSTTSVTAIEALKYGQVVVVSEEGIFKWLPQDKQFRNLNQRLGVGIDSISSVLHCIARTNDATVVIPYEQGFLMLPPEKSRFTIRPAISLTAVSLFFQPMAKPMYRFAADENHLTFRYNGISFTNPEWIRYRYKLLGYDTSWQYTADEQVSFPNLRPGNYKFIAEASLSEDFTGASQASYEFIIEQPVWQRLWFLLGIGVLLALSVYQYIRYRELQIQRIAMLQKERMLFEYEHLKSQVNPHFLFNSLNTLASLIEEDSDAAVDYTVELSELYRNMLSFRNQDLIPLREELVIVQRYMHIQSRRFGSALLLQTNIPDHIPDNRMIVPLSLQLLLENAIKHNIVSITYPLTITITWTGDAIEVSNPIQPKMSREKGAGLGLLNIRKRYGLLTSRAVFVTTENNTFKVVLPLL